MTKRTTTPATTKRTLAAAGAVRDRAVYNILINAGLRDETGASVTTFHPVGRDCMDFMTVSKAQLKAMLVEAYEHGVTHGRIVQGSK